MKKILIISALSILFPSAVTVCSENKGNGKKIFGAMALVTVAGLGIYYYKTKYHTPVQTPSLPNTSSNQTQEENQKKPNLSNPSYEYPYSNPEKTVENNTPQNSPIFPPQSKGTPHVGKPTEDSFLDGFYQALQKRLQENETEKLLSDHAFSH